MGCFSGKGVQIIQFDLENEELGLLEPPPVKELSFSNMSLGHGFQGQLSLSLSTPPSKNEKCFRLHIWVLQRNEGGGFWHKLLNIPMEDSSISSYVPLSFFHGRGDGAVNLLFQRNEEEIVQIIPGGVETVSGTIVSSFSFSESSLAIAMESRKFKATPLAAQTYLIVSYSRKATKLGKGRRRRSTKRSGIAQDSALLMTLTSRLTE